MGRVRENKKKSTSIPSSQVWYMIVIYVHGICRPVKGQVHKCFVRQDGLGTGAHAYTPS